MKNWKFIKTGNGKVGNKYEWTTRNGELQYFDYSVPFGGHKKGSVEKTSGGYTGYKMNGSIIISKKEFQTEEEAKKYVENKKACNSLTHDYHNKYPNDPIYADMKSSATLEAVKKEPWRVYEIIGVGDSIARERIFEMIEEKYKIDYNDIYEAWMGHSWDKAVQKKSMDEAKRLAQKLGIKIGNESINKQVWSMFKGLSKDAEKEVGNETYQHKLYPDKYVIIDGKNYKIITDGKVEKSGELTDAVLYGINQTYKRVSSMNSKTGNARLGKFLMEGGHTAELVEEGGKFIIKFDDGSTETFMTRKAADSYIKSHSELYIGNKKVENDEADLIKKGFVYKVNIPGKRPIYFNNPRQAQIAAEAQNGTVEKIGNKNIGNESIGDEYNAEINRLEKKKMDLERMGQGQKAREIEKQIQQLQKELREYDIGNKKTGNSTVDDEVVAREVVEGKEYIVEKTSLRNGQDVQFNLYYSMDGSGKRHAGVFKDKDSAVSAGKKIVGNSASEYEILKQDPSKMHPSYKKAYEEAMKKLDREDEDFKKRFEKEYGVKAKNGLARARNSIKTKNADITLWNGNDSAYIKEDGHVQYLENNSFVVDEDKYDSQEQAVEELTKKGYRKK